MLKKLVIFLGIIYTAIALFSCSPQKRLNRLVSNNPELAKIDTTHTEKTIETPAVKKDTVSQASIDVSGLYSIIDALAVKLDAQTKNDLKQQVGSYIVNRNCLDSPVTVMLPGGGYFKVWQESGKFHYLIDIPAKKQTIKVPLVVMKIEPVIHYNWGMFAAGCFTIIAVAGIVILLFKFKFIP